MSEPITKERFEAMTPRQKGYAVYMCGCRKDQPNVPEDFMPTEEDAEEYAAGAFSGAIEAQDSP